MSDLIAHLKFLWLSLRPRESLMMLGVPLLGILFATRAFDLRALLMVAGLFVASFFIAGHVYTLNDLFGLSYDIYDEYKRERPLIAQQLQEKEVLLFSVILLVLGLTVSLQLSTRVFTVMVSIVMIWLLYAWPHANLKSVPILTSVINGLGAGVLPFLLGYALFHPFDLRGLLLSLYFGLIAGAGQMNREIVDYEVDRRTHIRTTAIHLGRRRCFAYSFAIFNLSTIYFWVLAWSGFLPRALAVVLVPVVPLHYLAYRRTSRSGFGREEIVQYIKSYRAIYGLVGLGMVAILCLLR